MKKKLYLITTILLSAAALSLSSCLKDNRYVDFSKAGNIVDFPTQTFGTDAITESPDTDVNGTIVRQFAVNVATANVPTTATSVTLAVDNSIITSYVAAHPSIDYQPLPANAYSFTATTVVVTAGQQYATGSVTFYINLLDPSKSYMLPIKIVSATNGMKISGNQGIHYYHFIGNDFAGVYRQKYQRYNAADSTVALNGASFDFSAGNTITFFPVSPTEFTVYSGYVTSSQFRYDVTFTKTGTTYTNFHVSQIAADVAANAPSITVAVPPVFFDPATGKPATADLPGPYTFAQAQEIFHFAWTPMTTAPRYILDTYLK